MRNIFNKKILLLFFFGVILLCPNKVYADVYSGAESFPENHTTDCKKYLNISISASKYSRATDVNSNKVSSRTVSITCKGRCKAYIYHANYGELEKIGENEDSKGDRTTSDADEDSTGYGKTVKTFTDSYSWNLDAGQEALIVVLSLNKKECKTTDDNGNCTEYKYPKKVVQEKKCDKEGKNCKWVNMTDTIKDKNGKDVVVDVTCPKGRFNTDDDPTTVGDVELKGNGAALFIQNPNETGLVSNLRHKDAEYGTACKNAANGIFDSDDNNKVKKFSINRGNSEIYNDYITNYYNKMLSYCNDTFVPFNLKSSQIKNISNNLLKVFYYREKLKAGNYKQLEVVKKEIADLEEKINQKYGPNSNHILSSNSNLTRSLSCDKKTSTDKEEEYLYKTKEDKIYANLSTGKVPVCTTQCYEHLTVKYNPPALLKAGQCFSYKVTVKSNAECGVEDEFDLSKVKPPQACSPSPICENRKNHTQAGPNEEFDSCIKDCDGGNYSQKCINSCYKKVYGNKKKTANTSKSKSSSKISSMNYTNNTPIIRYLASDDNYEEKDLVNYPAENNNPSCNTKHIIDYVHKENESALDTCADYFFQAKTLYPYGWFNNNGTKWKPNGSVVNSDGATSEKTESIPMQIARSAPFFVRSPEEVKSLLKAMVVPASPSGFWRKYNIDEEGIKRQYSSRYKCNQTCSFTGCNSNDALTPSAYSTDLKNDLNEISNALSKCAASSSCDTEEKTTTFEMKINVKRENNNSENPEQTGTTTLGETQGRNGLDEDGDGNADIFVAEKGEQGSGILGLCYDKRNSPHYQTTITYPGTYINYKSAKRLYTETNDDTYFYKKNYMCTPYDSVDVNEKYWIWAKRDKFNPVLYPSDFSPEWNISASLGKTNTGFGKYNWKINFQCFYSVYNEVPIPIPTPTPIPDNPPKDSCSSEYSTKFCNTKFRIVTSNNLFPDKSGNKKSASEIPYNWSKDAQDMVAKNSNNIRLNSYGINPAVYKEQLEAAAATNSEASFGGNMAYHIYLTKENIQALKRYAKQNGYSSFKGTYTPIEEQDGLYYYSMGQDLTSNFSKFEDTNANKGYNYSTHNYNQ